MVIGRDMEVVVVAYLKKLAEYLHGVSEKNK
jgi:hypothetical protein